MRFLWRCSPLIESNRQIEAVGHNYLGTFFASADALLAPGGVMVMQAITTPEERYEEYIRSTDFINTIIFPGTRFGRIFFFHSSFFSFSNPFLLGACWGAAVRRIPRDRGLVGRRCSFVCLLRFTFFITYYF